MAHVRKLIRDNIKTTITGLTTVGTNVFQSRVYPVAAPKLPCMMLYSKDEIVEYHSIGSPRLQERIVNFTIEVFVRGSSGYDDQIDQICLEVEEALYTDLSRGGNAIETKISNFDADFNGDGDQPVGIATLTVEVRYQVRENNPDVAI